MRTLVQEGTCIAGESVVAGRTREGKGTHSVDGIINNASSV